ncbi:hypothetical protein GCM10020331_079350 [Ectobacillus funiculus]
MKVEITHEGLAEVFGLGPSRSPGHGVFAGVNELRPAHALTFTKKWFEKFGVIGMLRVQSILITLMKR